MTIDGLSKASFYIFRIYLVAYLTSRIHILVPQGHCILLDSDKGIIPLTPTTIVLVFNSITL
jgi:hypothetical protein